MACSCCAIVLKHPLCCIRAKGGRGGTPPPPQFRRPNSAGFADLFWDFVGFLNFTDLFRRFVGVSVILPIHSADVLRFLGF